MVEPIHPAMSGVPPHRSAPLIWVVLIAVFVAVGFFLWPFTWETAPTDNRPVATSGRGDLPVPKVGSTAGERPVEDVGRFIASPHELVGKEAELENVQLVRITDFAYWLEASPDHRILVMARSDGREHGPSGEQFAVSQLSGKFRRIEDLDRSGELGLSETVLRPARATGIYLEAERIEAERAPGGTQ